MSTVSSSAVHKNENEAEYLAYLDRIQRRVDQAEGPLFRLNVDDLWDLYLAGFGNPWDRQYHNCHACRRFIDQYGSLATISEDGVVTPLIWSLEDTPPAYIPSVEKMLDRLRMPSGCELFLSSSEMLGERERGGWFHLSAKLPSSRVYRGKVQTAHQAMAEKREDYKNIQVALQEFRREHVAQAVQLLRSESLYRSEKVLGAAEWLLSLHDLVEKHRGQRNWIIWRQVATAPPGFCHPRSSMIGTLLEDLAAGKSYESASRSFAAKMHPLQYQRPQAPPSAGAIAQAEKIVEQLRAAGSLERRFARVDELRSLWRPSPKASPTSKGVFDHLLKKNEPTPMTVTETPITWVKFERTVLPNAEKIWALAVARGNYAAMVTAVHPDAPPILQWDLEHDRNPVSYYVWHGGSPASHFCLRAGQYFPVTAVCLAPSMWAPGFSHHGKGVFWAMKGARETRNGGLALFPESLKSEWHGIRSVIEAYSKSGTIQGMEQPHAAGLMFSDHSDIHVMVQIGAVTTKYYIDRWE